MRIGIGYDLHRLIPVIEKNHIRVGGVDIPCFARADCHSDGDVLLHALVDACLGALALGDIGQWFPDTDPVNKGRNSVEFVDVVLTEIHRLGWEIQQVDSIVLLDKPKLAPHIDTMRQTIARLIKTELSSVSVKAKTFEGMGPGGKESSIAAHVVLTLKEHRA